MLAFNRSIEKIPGGCWIWTGSRITGGYGVIGYRGKPQPAHRISYIEHNGDIPVGLLVCHRCDTPACVNPDHLFLGTQKDNVRDMLKKERQKFGLNAPHVNFRKRRLTPDQVRQIRGDPRSLSQLATVYGVSGSVIQCVKARSRYRNIT